MGSAKLTAADVLEIRRRYADGETVTALAGKFGVRHGTIGPIVHRKTWTHI